MGKLTISMAIFNSKLLVCQRVFHIGILLIGSSHPSTAWMERYGAWSIGRLSRSFPWDTKDSHSCGSPLIFKQMHPTMHPTNVGFDIFLDNWVASEWMDSSNSSNGSISHMSWPKTSIYGGRPLSPLRSSHNLPYASKSGHPGEHQGNDMKPIYQREYSIIYIYL